MYIIRQYMLRRCIGQSNSAETANIFSILRKTYYFVIFLKWCVLLSSTSIILCVVKILRLYLTHTAKQCHVYISLSQTKKTSLCPPNSMGVSSFTIKNYTANHLRVYLFLYIHCTFPSRSVKPMSIGTYRQTDKIQKLCNVVIVNNSNRI